VESALRGTAWRCDMVFSFACVARVFEAHDAYFVQGSMEHGEIRQERAHARHGVLGVYVDEEREAVEALARGALDAVDIFERLARHDSDAVRELEKAQHG